MKGEIMKFAKFMSSNDGRILRILVGVALIFIGIVMHSTGGYILAIIGLVPLLAGSLDFCLIAPLMHLPFSGKAIRACPAKKLHSM